MNEPTKKLLLAAGSNMPDRPAMGSFSLTPGKEEIHISKKRERSAPDQILHEYLIENSEVYRKLDELRENGWRSPEADKHFEEAQKNADFADSEGRRFFFDMMIKIGIDMHHKTRVMTPMSALHESTLPVNILDLCMAPGGYSVAALKFNPDAAIWGITLPVTLGGHENIIMTSEHRVKVKAVIYDDITSFVPASSESMHSFLKEIPDESRFKFDIPFGEHNKFQLVFCDGQALRTHVRSEHREKNNKEPRRLQTSQLIIALWGVEDGGNIVIKFHNLDLWDTVRTVRGLETFCNIKLYKPDFAHGDKGSFYCICKNVLKNNSEYMTFMANLTAEWWSLTVPRLQSMFEGLNSGANDGVTGAQKLVKDWGKRYLNLGEPLWETQRKSLEKKDWANKASPGSAKLADKKDLTSKSWVRCSSDGERRLNTLIKGKENNTDKMKAHHQGALQTRVSPAWTRGGNWRDTSRNAAVDDLRGKPEDFNFARSGATARGRRRSCNSKPEGVGRRQNIGVGIGMGMDLGRGGANSTARAAPSPLDINSTADDIAALSLKK